MFQSADDIAAAYFAMRDKRYDIQALDLRMIHGEKCLYCGGPKTTVVRRMVRGQREWHEVCADCHRPWEPDPWTDCVVLRGEIQTSPRAGAIEERLTEKFELWERVQRTVEPPPDGFTSRRWRSYLRLIEDFQRGVAAKKLDKRDKRDRGEHVGRGEDFTIGQLAQVTGRTEQAIRWVFEDFRRRVESRALDPENRLLNRRRYP